MNLFGRHVVRRVAGIGMGVALLVLGLEVPAYAAVPTITAILPTSPSPGCEASLTGTNLNTPAITTVTFTQGGTDHAGTVAFIDGDTQAEVGLPTSPTLTASTATTVRVHNTSGDSATFSFTTGPAGTCPDVPVFTPSSGAVGTSVTITPHDGGSPTFSTAPTAVRFNTGQATPTSSTATSVTATVPCGAATGRIHVYTAAGQSTSTTSFTVTSTPTPTISTFTPTSGPVGTSVTITGTNFSGTGFTTTSVTFNNVTSTFTVPLATQIKATVPSTATTGPIKVTTPCGSITSTTNFTVTVITKHARNVTLRLSDKLSFAGNVKVADGFAPCRSGVPVKFQRRVNGTWKTLRSTVTTVTGKYAGKVKNKHGKFRALAPKVVRNGGTDVCKKAVSPVRTH